MRKPNLFIVGEPKSGTSALWWFLKQHPDIFMTEYKEPSFFAQDGLRDRFSLWRNKIKRVIFFEKYPVTSWKVYTDLFKPWKDEKIGGEATTGYLHSTEAAQKIHAYNPDAKIIMLFREPVEFLYSYFYQHKWMGRETSREFKDVFNLEKERKQGKKLPRRFNITPSHYYYTERVKFADHAKRYLDLFDKKNIKIIIYDDFKKDNAKMCKEIFDFLDVDSSFVPEFKIINPSKVPRFRLLRDFILLPPVYKVLKKIVAIKPFRGLKTVYENQLTRAAPRPPLDPEFRKELMKQFKPEVEKLSTLIDRDLVSLWGYDTV